MHRKILSMNSRVCCALISFCLFWFFQWSNAVNEEGTPGLVARSGFLAYKSISTYQKFCNCKTSTCSCCQTVTILYTKAEKNLCVDFTYAKSGLNVDVSLDSSTVTTKMVSEYKPLTFCVHVPMCRFSFACVNILELNKFPRSVTACVRLDIVSKKRLWHLNYTCVSIPAELPMMSNNATVTTTMSPTMPSSSSQMTTKATTTTKSTTTTTKTTTITTMIPPKAETEGTTRDVEIITVPGPTVIVDID